MSHLRDIEVPSLRVAISFWYAWFKFPSPPAGKIRRSATVRTLSQRLQAAGRSRMTGSISGEADLRHWLIDCLVTNIGCTPDEVDPDPVACRPRRQLRDASCCPAELSERCWAGPYRRLTSGSFPTINALAAYLARTRAPSPDSDAAVKRGARNSLDEATAVIGMGMSFSGGISCPEALWDFLRERRSSNQARYRRNDASPSKAGRPR